MESRRRAEERRASTSTLQPSARGLAPAFSVDEWWLCCEAVTQYRELGNIPRQESYAGYLQKTLVGMSNDVQVDGEIAEPSDLVQTKMAAKQKEKQGQDFEEGSGSGDLISAGWVCEMVERFESLETEQRGIKIDGLPSQVKDEGVVTQTLEKPEMDRTGDQDCDVEPTLQHVEQSSRDTNCSEPFCIVGEELESSPESTVKGAETVGKHQDSFINNESCADCEEQSRFCCQDAATMTCDIIAPRTTDVSTMACLPPRIVTTSGALSDSELDPMERIVIRDNPSRSPASWSRDEETSQVLFGVPESDCSLILDSPEAVDSMEECNQAPQDHKSWPGQLITCVLSIIGTLGILHFKEKFFTTDFTDAKIMKSSRQLKTTSSCCQNRFFTKGSK